MLLNCRKRWLHGENECSVTRFARPRAATGPNAMGRHACGGSAARGAPPCAQLTWVNWAAPPDATLLYVTTPSFKLGSPPGHSRVHCGWLGRVSPTSRSDNLRRYGHLRWEGCSPRRDTSDASAQHVEGSAGRVWSLPWVCAVDPVDLTRFLGGRDLSSQGNAQTRRRCGGAVPLLEETLEHRRRTVQVMCRASEVAAIDSYQYQRHLGAAGRLGGLAMAIGCSILHGPRSTPHG